MVDPDRQTESFSKAPCSSSTRSGRLPRQASRSAQRERGGCYQYHRPCYPLLTHDSFQPVEISFSTHSHTHTHTHLSDRLRPISRSVGARSSWRQRRRVLAGCAASDTWRSCSPLVERVAFARIARVRGRNVGALVCFSCAAGYHFSFFFAHHPTPDKLLLLFFSGVTDARR